MLVYVPRYSEYLPFDCEFAEVDGGVPVHPADLRQRVRDLIGKGLPIATYSPIVIAIIGWLVRKKEITLPVRFIHIAADGTEKEDYMDCNGDLVCPWPEEGQNSVIEATFYYRYE